MDLGYVMHIACLVNYSVRLLVFFPLSQAVYEYVDNNLSIASSSDTELFGKNVM